MQAPDIDTRTYDEVVTQTAQLAGQFSGWRPRPDGGPDAGQALIGVFGRFAELVIERLNRAPDKNYLAFLNLIGATPLPPRAARVPLTFHLATGSPVDAVVPAGVLAAAAPLPPEQDDVVFETERLLVVTRAQLQAAYVSDTEHDTYSDRSAQATGAADQPFAVFAGDQPAPHQLYLACDPLLTQPGQKDVVLALTSPDAWQWLNWQISWAYWDGDGAAWQPVTSSAAVADGAWRVTLPALPALVPSAVNGIEAGWLRAQLDLPLPPGHSGPLPRLGGTTAAVQPGAPASPVPPKAAFGNAVGIDLSKDFYPFGQQPQFNDTFYVACPDALARPGAVITVGVTLTNPPQAPSGQVPPPVRTQGDPTIAWEVSDGSQWHAVPADYAFTGDGQVSMRLPDPAEPATVNGQQGYWLRARLVGGDYGTPASYEQSSGNTYTYTKATFAPPVVKTLTITAAAAAQPPAPVTACLSYNDFGYADHTAAAAGTGPPCTPFTPTADTEPALYLGFDQPFSQRPVTLFLEVEPPLPEQVAAGQLAAADLAAATHLTWEYASPAGWSPLGAVDETQGLSHRDLVTFVGPADLTARSCFGQTLSWLRLRWQDGTFPILPQLRRVLLNTTWAAQVSTVDGEILGSSNGGAGQAFAAAQTPVQPGQQVTVREPQRPAPAEEQALARAEGADAVTVTQGAAGQPDEIWVRWHAVPDFYQSGPRDRHYTVDPLSGVISFGDGSSGLIPPIGPNNIRMTYRTGGGEQGNRAAATIVELKSSVPYIDGVTNNEPSQGGAPVEPIDRVQARGPKVLRHRDRAVAAADLEDLAAAASADVAAAAAIVPIFNPYSLWLDPQAPAPTPDHALVEAGRMGVIIVPNEPASARPTPSLVLLSQVQDYLRQRCPPTAGLWVAGPEWIAVTVQATVVVTAVAEADPAADLATAALAGYLHPLTGGPDGQGWAFGSRPHGSDLTALLAAIAGVDHVRSLSVTYEPETADAERKLALQRILARPLTEPSDAPERERDLTDWLDRALVYSGTHQVSVALA